MADFVLVGAGGHASVVFDAAYKAGHRVRAVLSERAVGESFFGHRIQSPETLMSLLAPDLLHVHVAIGDAKARRRLATRATELGFGLLTVVHPMASVADSATLGPGSFVAAGSVVAPGATVGSGCIVNHRVCVDHDVVLGAWSHIAPGVTIGGHAVIGEEVWVGMGSVIRDRARIGERSLIGAGSVVLRDIPAGVVAYGQPARAIRRLDQQG